MHRPLLLTVLATVGACLALTAAPAAAQAQEPGEPCATFEPNTDPGSVHTNACITAPSGCTANFIFQRGDQEFPGVSDGRNHFIGTAGHCVGRAGEPVYMDTNPLTVKVGEVWKKVDGGPGNDFALVRIDEGWPLDPEMPGFPEMPQGIYAGCDGGQALGWWGHGYGVAVGPGQPGTGVIAQWWDRVFGWDGDALPGDSGSGVVLTETGEAAGNLTHLVLDPKYSPSINAGTRLTHALAWAGGNIYLVNADGTLADAPRNTRCGNPNNGGGKG